MKWILIGVLLFMFTAGSAIAGGDKNRGDKGEGSVHQVVGP